MIQVQINVHLAKKAFNYLGYFKRKLYIFPIAVYDSYTTAILSFFHSDITLLKTNAAPRFDEEKAATLMPAELTVTTNEMMIAVTNFFIKNGLP